jgi:hypothetical protein
MKNFYYDDFDEILEVKKEEEIKMTANNGNIEIFFGPRSYYKFKEDETLIKEKIIIKNILDKASKISEYYYIYVIFMFINIIIFIGITNKFRISGPFIPISIYNFLFIDAYSAVFAMGFSIGLIFIILYKLIYENYFKIRTRIKFNLKKFYAYIVVLGGMIVAAMASSLGESAYEKIVKYFGM